MCKGQRVLRRKKSVPSRGKGERVPVGVPFEQSPEGQVTVCQV